MDCTVFLKHKNLGRRFAIRFLAAALFCFFCFFCFAPCFFAGVSPAYTAVGGPIYVEGAPLQGHSQPLQQEGVFYFPLRALAEQAGFEVRWESDLKRVTLKGKGREAALYPGNPLYAVNGILHRTAHPPVLLQGRTFVSPDLLEKAVGLVLQAKGEGAYYFSVSCQPFAPETGSREQPVYFVELLLPQGERVRVDEAFEIRLAAPFVRGIYAYEVSFFYNPALIQVRDVHNPSFQPGREFSLKQINNREGQLRYTLTTLGVPPSLPPRGTLVVIEAVASREGAVPLLQGTLVVTLLDGRAHPMPAGLEERVLNVVRP